MRDIRNKLRETDPEFCLMTEGTIDALMTDVDVFHGLGPGSMITPDAFPAMFRYTFPESIIIQLNPNPILPGYEANYAAIHGLRHEIMSRYQADADYLAHGKIPGVQDYSTVNYPPDIHKIRETAPESAIKYLYKLIQFENEHAEFFRNGTFIDEDGIEYSGENILSKGFKSGELIGVVVWNTDLSVKKEYKVSVPGHKLIDVSEPGNAKIDPDAALGANSLRLLVFRKSRRQ